MILIEPYVATVSQVNNYIKRVIDSSEVLNDISVKGEISNFKHHYSGHMYMSLKDDGGVLKAVMFKGSTFGLKFVPQDGMRVIARGRISVYEQGGAYQLYINEMLPDGAGAFYAAFEKLKAQLENEGLFAPEHKKKLPVYPKRVGVVTASTGAAVRDIINVISRRCPSCEIILKPTIVQGQGSAKSIVEAIELFNRYNAADVLIVGRGGGSIEDLWSFNEEAVARSIYNSEIPIISAVGHETDFTIADFVADLRAPTPSAAAELCVPSSQDMIAGFDEIEKRIINSMLRIIERNRIRVSSFSIRTPQDKLDERRQYIDTLTTQLESAFKLNKSELSEELSKLASSLDAMSPLRVLARGYSVATSKDGNVIKSVKQLPEGTEFLLRLPDGEKNCISR